MPQLRYHMRDGRTALLDLMQDEVSIGRLSKCDIVISQPTVSRRHAVVYRKGARWVIADQGSSHGTLVNGTWIVEKVLSDGDQITIGPEVILFIEATDDDAHEPAAADPMLFKEGDDETTGGDGAHRDLTEIIAEHALESGQIMTTIARARRLDVTQIIENPQKLIAALAKPVSSKVSRFADFSIISPGSTAPPGSPQHPLSERFINKRQPLASMSKVAAPIIRSGRWPTSLRNSRIYSISNHACPIYSRWSDAPNRQGSKAIR